MFLGYTVRTRDGQATYPYTDDNNIAAGTARPRGSYFAVKDPSAAWKSSGRALFMYPIAGGMSPQTLSILHANAGKLLYTTSEGVPVYLGEPQPAILATAMQGGVIVGKTTMPLGQLLGMTQADFPDSMVSSIKPPDLLVPVPLIICLLMWIVIGTTAAVITWCITNVFVSGGVQQTERDRLANDRMTMVAQSQKIVREWDQDINKDGIADVHFIEYANGDVWGFALNDAGKAFLGGNSKQMKKGVDMEDLAKDIEKSRQQETTKWTDLIIYGTIGVATVTVLYFGAKYLATHKKKEG